MRRRRSCNRCGHRFTTFERAELPPLRVHKRDGSTEPFDPAKIAAGIRAAAKARPVSEDDVAAVVAEVERRLVADLPPERAPVVPTTRIGALVLDELRRLDEVAYLRFASVYKEFAAVDDFAREVVALSGEGHQDGPGVSAG